MNCPKCNADNLEGEHFCRKCGESLLPVPAQSVVLIASQRKLPMLQAAIIAIIVIIAVGVFIVFSLPATPGGGQPPVNSTVTHNKPTEPISNLPLNELPLLDSLTKAYFENYTKDLASALGISGDPFNLDSGSKAKLQAVLIALNSTEPVIVFNGQVYHGLEEAVVGDSYYIKPKGFTGPQSEYLNVLAKEAINPDEFFGGDDVQGHVLKLAYEGLIAGRPKPQTVAEISSYLDTKVSAGAVSNYNFDNASRELTLILPSIDMPIALEPFDFAKSADYVIKAYADPQQYVEKVISYYETALSSGNTVVISTKETPAFEGVFGNEELLIDISALVQPFSKDDALLKIAGTARFQASESAGSASPTGMAVAAGSAASGSGLLDRLGAIVSPVKSTSYMRGPEYYGQLNLVTLDDLRNPTGSFVVFHANGYTTNIVQLVQRGQKSVENLANLLHDTNQPIVYLNAHGAEGRTLMEVYYIGSNLTTPDALKNLKAFRQRRDELWSEYDADSLMIVLVKKVPEVAESVLPTAGQVNRARDSLKNNDTFGVVRVYDSFYKDQTVKKALFFLMSCYGGSLANSIDSRVLLTSKPEFETNYKLFVMSDLMKLSKYLYKDQAPGSIGITTADPDNMRNYNMLTGFTQNQMESYASCPNVTLNDECMAKKDTLCSVVLYGTPGQTVSASPHIKSASGGRIEFNAPMESSIPADQVVTIDASKCSGAKSEDLGLKPEWDSSDGYGDKILKLPWMGGVYRDWTDSDFKNGRPNGDYAIITVKSDTAVSKLSRVQLTGNPDCCTKSGCKQTECWKKPDTIKYNGNKPKSDFVFMMPCSGIYYKLCAQGNGTVRAKLLRLSDPDALKDVSKLPAEIRFEGNCYRMATTTDGNTVDVDINKNDLVIDEQCKAKCGPNSTGGDCMQHILIGESLYPNYQGDRSLSLVIDGQPSDLKSSDECTNQRGGYMGGKPVAAFGNHTAYGRVGPCSGKYCYGSTGSPTGSAVSGGVGVRGGGCASGPSCSKEDADAGLCQQSFFELVYDGSTIYKSENYVSGILDISLYGDHILATLKSNYLDDKFQIYFDGKVYDGDAVGYGSCVMSRSSFACVNSEKYLTQNGRTVLQLYTGGRSLSTPYPSTTLLGGSAFFLNDNLLFVSDDRRLRLVGPGINITFNVTVSDGMPSIDHNFFASDSLGDYALFGQHVVYEKGATIVYDGEEIGKGHTPAIFGDSLAYIAYCNPLLEDGTCCHTYSSQAECSAHAGCVWDETYLGAGQINACLNSYATEQNVDDARKTWIFFNGIYYDVNGEIGLEPGNSCHIYGSELILFDGHLAFTMSCGDRTNLIYDWKDLGEIEHIPILFGNHVVFTRQVNGRDHIIYDGKDLGPGDSPIIVGDNVAFYPGGDNIDSVYFDGKVYGAAGGPRDVSIMGNMYACYRYYLENNVGTSPYGTVSF